MYGEAVYKPEMKEGNPIRFIVWMKARRYSVN